MTVDEFDFRNLCRDLEASYLRLGRLRDARPRPPEVRSALKPAPGPQAPGNGVAVWTLIDCETRLRSVAFNAFADIDVKLVDGDGRAFRLCQLMAFHAAAIAQLEWADDLMDELRDQDRKLTKAIERIEPAEMNIPTVEHRITATQVAKQLALRGHNTTPDAVRGWARHNHISTRPLDNGRAGYKLSEALKHIKGKHQQP